MACLDQVAARIVASGALRVAVTGVDGAGKTRFAEGLAQALRQMGQAVLLAHVDDFHNPRAVRYSRGRMSPEGFYRDTTNLAGLRAALLDPLAPGGDRLVRSRIFDHARDCAVEEPPVAVVPGTILILEGIFLIRPDLAASFDLTLFLDAPFAQTFRRMAQRDGCDPNPMAAANARYRLGQEMWLAEMRPHFLADIVVDNSDYTDPRLTRNWPHDPPPAP
jgi:uridine kinase